MDPSDGVYSLGKRSSWAGKTLVLTVFSLKVGYFRVLALLE